MKLGDKPVNNVGIIDLHEPELIGGRYIECRGITLRQYYAGLAMQANRANPQYSEAKSEEIAKYAVEDADALLKELEK